MLSNLFLKIIVPSLNVKHLSNSARPRYRADTLIRHAIKPGLRWPDDGQWLGTLYHQSTKRRRLYREVRTIQWTEYTDCTLGHMHSVQICGITRYVISTHQCTMAQNTGQAPVLHRHNFRLDSSLRSGLNSMDERQLRQELSSSQTAVRQWSQLLEQSHMLDRELAAIAHGKTDSLAASTTSLTSLG